MIWKARIDALGALHHIVNNKKTEPNDPALNKRLLLILRLILRTIVGLPYVFFESALQRRINRARLFRNFF